jgi:hypothetical protein
MGRKFGPRKTGDLRGDSFGDLLEFSQIEVFLNREVRRLESDIRKGYVAGVCLQTNKARVGIDARRIRSDRIGRAAPDLCLRNL